jgi:hypothetical protein
VAIGDPRAYLEFYRIDQGGAVWRIFVPSVALLTVGPPLVLFSATMKQIEHHEWLGFLGALLMLIGLVIGISGLASLLLDDRYLAVVEEGLVVHVTKEEVLYAWDDLVEVRCEGNTLVLVPRNSGAPVLVPFSKTTLADITPRLEEWRRKSAWNLAPKARG